MKIFSTYFAIGLLGGIMLAFVREHMQNNFETMGDLEEKLKLPALGIVPLLNKPAKGGQMVGGPERHFIREPRSSFSEAVNHIRTGVLFSHVDNPLKVIMVTSAVQGEGKTTLSSNLALSFSQLGRTLLLDADLRKPRVAQIAGLGKEAGLVELVANRKTMKECIVRDRDAMELYILRTGTIPPNPLELLSSDKFKNIIFDLKRHFEYIVIDTAPILPVSDSIVLGQCVDGILVTVRAEKTPYPLVRDALKRLKIAKLTPVGTVLSLVDQRRMSYYHYDKYHYYDKYYNYYSNEADKKKRVS